MLPLARPVSRTRALLDIADVAGFARTVSGLVLDPGYRTGDKRTDAAANHDAADRNGAGGAHEASQRSFAAHPFISEAARLGICQARKPKTSAAPTTSM